MLRNFDDLRIRLKDRRAQVLVALGVLLAANLAAAVFAFHPWGGSAEDLAKDLRDNQKDLAQRVKILERTRSLVAKVEQAKVEGDKFLDECTLPRRNAFSTLIGEIDKMAMQTGMQPREASWAPEAVQGSDTLWQLSISANYEGNYGSLTKFINLLDRSPRFLIIESMQATPQASGALGVNIKLDTFIRDAPEPVDAVGGKS